MLVALVRNMRPKLRGLLVALIAAMISGVGTVLAAPAAASGGLVSDDFFAGLDTDRWRVVDPVGDGSVSGVGAGTGDARLAIGVPGGVSHDAWGGNGSVRVLQGVQDADFEVLAKFDSVPAGKYADQGLQVHAVGSWLRFSVYAADNGRLIAFAARTVGTSSVKVLSREVSAPDGQMWLRVSRVGSGFTYAYSSDGEAWTTIGSVTHDMVVERVGPYAGNAGGSNAVAHTALVDFVFDTAAPISPEDGGLSGGGDPADTTSPSISGVTVTPAAGSARVSWVTDEPTTGQVEFGTTDAYGQTAVVTTSATTHEVTLSDLSPETTYHYRIVASDSAGNQSTTADATFTTTSGTTGPFIDLWHEGTLTFGANGMTQPWANVLGNVGDPDGVAELSYTLNSSDPQLLTLGPDERRLQDKGDFNADIETSALRAGDNTVVLTATDALGNRTVLSTTVRLVDSAAPPLPYTLAWSAGVPVQDQATVVDGDWRVVSEELRTTQVGYDRMVALGDVSWRDYEVTVPVSVSSFGPDAHTTSGAPLIGFGLRWQGHNGIGSWQPAWKYFPVGAYAWCRFDGYFGPKLEILGNENDPNVSVFPDFTPFEFDVRYVMKARVETMPDGTSRYAFKMWPQSEPEPAGWAVDVVDTGPATGSVALIAHHVDASFGTVTVTPLA